MASRIKRDVGTAKTKEAAKKTRKISDEVFHRKTVAGTGEVCIQSTFLTQEEMNFGLASFLVAMLFSWVVLGQWRDFDCSNCNGKGLGKSNSPFVLGAFRNFTYGDKMTYIPGTNIPNSAGMCC